jgi:hypothetical protein
MLALVALNIMDMETRLAALCESENTNVKFWPPPLEPLGETESAEGTCGTFRLSVADWLKPLKPAVTVALWLLLTVPEVAVKVAALCPDATVTLAGTVSNPLLLASETIAALIAALFKVTVQVLDALLPRVEGAQVIDVSCAGAAAETALSVKLWETPFRLAVSNAV